MKWKLVGFFRELAHGVPEASSLAEAVNSSPNPSEANILQYLESGEIDCIAPCMLYDYFEPSGHIGDSLYTLSDGEWVWPSDLKYYVRKYHVNLPDEFMEHMVSNSWKVPDNVGLPSDVQSDEVS